MGAIELATATGIVIGALTLFCVKIVAQVQSNKFKICKCCGNECVREVEIPTQEIQVNRSDVMSPPPQPHNSPREPRPTLLSDTY